MKKPAMPMPQASQTMAARVERETGGDRGEQVRRAWKLAFGREPRQGELQAALTHLGIQERNLGNKAKALASLCHVLLNANEFTYID